jgi:Uncharacterized protein, putative amidase
MRSVQIEKLRPQEILAEKERKSIVYLPVAPLEWHGPAMPIGTDPMAAEAVAREVAKRVGGVVMPTLYFGTERELKPELLNAIGFDHPEDRYVVGIDFPNNTMPSFYSKEDTFGMVVREYLRMLVLQKYRLIVIVNGHGATNQINTLERLAIEFSGETASKVYTSMGFDELTEEECQEFGHASLLETSEQIFLDPENVDLSMLPPPEEKIKSRDWGIVDTATFQFNPNEDKTVIFDPRNATEEKGMTLFYKAAGTLAREVEAVWEKQQKGV